MRIGSLEVAGNVFLAPMAGITDTPFRRIVQEFGVSAVWTEMISSDAVASAKAEFRTTELEGHSVPAIFQITGKRPEVMARAAALLEQRGAAAIDINMGCPARKVVSKGSGAALMKDVGLATAITRAVRNAIRVPLTAKIRSGWDEQNKNAVEFARALEEEGCDALIIHCRSRSKVHSGPPDLQVIAEVKEAVNIPVIGNGGINAVEDALRMTKRSDCDGVMVGRGALGRPWFPSQLIRMISGGIPETDINLTYSDIIRKHLDFELEWWGGLKAVRKMRKHLAWYSKGFDRGAEFRHEVFRLEDPDKVIDSVEKFFGKVSIYEV
jgi:tRNA-dihydrouridine synthase B